MMKVLLNTEDAVDAAGRRRRGALGGARPATSDRLRRWPDGFDHVEPVAGAAAPPPPAPTDRVDGRPKVTARYRLANATRVSLYAHGLHGPVVGLAGGHSG